MNKKNFGLIFSISLILSSITLLEAKEYSSDRYGNTNINVIDGVVIVNDKIESVLDNNEQLSIDIDDDGDEDYDISVDNEVGVMIESEDYGISVDNEVDVMVKIGDSSIIVDDDDISVDIGGLLDIGGLITID